MKEPKVCVYCDFVEGSESAFRNPIKVWGETGELVCWSCRDDMLDEEFFGDGDHLAQEQMEKEIQARP